MTTEESSSTNIAASRSLHDQDVIIFDPENAAESVFRLSHKGNALLCDLVCLQLLFSSKAESTETRSDEEVNKIAKHIFDVLTTGHTYILPDTEAITQKYLKGGSRFMKEKKSGIREQADEKSSIAFLQSLIKELEKRKLADSKESPAFVASSFEKNDQHSTGIPEAQDILFVKRTQSKMLSPSSYSLSKGKERYLNLIDEYLSVTRDTGNLGVKIAEAAVAIMNVTTEQTSSLRKSPGKERRFVAVDQEDNKVNFSSLEHVIAAELTLILLFEKLHDKSVTKTGEATAPHIKPSKQVGESSEKPSFVQPGKEPIAVPEPHDVLFGRGGLTNNHKGNRRFRDIISLHRPDYVRAIKVEKPNVSRRIVKAIRRGFPNGRFLKKNSRDNMWYDVGDKHAAEKTSQALRERTRKQSEDEEARTETGKRKLDEMTVSRQGKVSMYNHQNQAPGGAQNDLLTSGPTYFGMAPNNSNVVVPPQFRPRPYGMALQMPSVGTSCEKAAKHKESNNDKDVHSRNEGSKKQKLSVSKKGGKEFESGKRADSLEESEFVPLDKDGNILVTDHDILCGRGGLTNHHRGNKRFRDVVALHRPDYVRASKVQKPGVARMIVQAIRNSDPPGRFLKKNEETGKWYDVGDKQAAIKASQALRERIRDRNRDRSLKVEKSQKPALIMPRQHPPYFAPYTNIVRGTAIVTGDEPKVVSDSSSQYPKQNSRPARNDQGSISKTVEI